MINNKTKVITGLVTFSYANVWEAKSVNGGEEYYSASIIISKDDIKTVNSINDAIKSAIEQGKLKFGWRQIKGLKLPLRDGDAERDDEVYKNSWFLSSKSKIKPQIVDKNVNPILDQSEFYSGCRGRASIVFYPFSVNGNSGIACGLCNLQKLENGTALSGRSRAQDEFSNFEEEDFLD